MRFIEKTDCKMSVRNGGVNTSGTYGIAFFTKKRVFNNMYN